jgi:molybdenum cofactor biosynthesis enzyme
LDKVKFISELVPDKSVIKVYCVAAITSAKTGVEMESLIHVMTGLLTIYDLSKINAMIAN